MAINFFENDDMLGGAGNISKELKKNTKNIEDSDEHESGEDKEMDTKKLGESVQALLLREGFTHKELMEFVTLAETLDFLDKENYRLNENANVVRLNKMTKMEAIAARLVLVFAKLKKDPLYFKYTKFNSIRLGIREILKKKYMTHAMARARELVNSTGFGQH